MDGMGEDGSLSLSLSLFPPFLFRVSHILLLEFTISYVRGLKSTIFILLNVLSRAHPFID